MRLPGNICTGSAIRATSPAGQDGRGQAVLVRLFDNEGRLIVGYGSSEDATNLRGYDAATGRWLWSVGGSADVHGLAVRSMMGAIDMLKPSGTKGLITRIDPKTGKVVRRGDRDPGTFAFERGADAVGLAELDGRLYVADAKANVIRHGPIEPPALDQANSIAARPTSPSADPATGRVWVISRGSRLLALDPDGQGRGRRRAVDGAGGASRPATGGSPSRRGRRGRSISSTPAIRRRSNPWARSAPVTARSARTGPTGSCSSAAATTRVAT